MKTILLLFLFTAKTVVAAESNHLTPEFLFQQAKKIKTEEERQLLFEKVFASKNIENVKAMRQLPRLCLGFSLFDYLEKQEDSHFKDQIMIMIMNEPWRNDIESTVEGSSGMGPELYFIKYLEKRAPELNLHTGPGTQERFLSHKTRKEVANALQAKIDKEKSAVLINPKSQDSEVVPATSVTSANGSESQRSLSTTVPEPATKQPAIRYILPVFSVTILSLLYFLVKKRHK